MSKKPYRSRNAGKREQLDLPLAAWHAGLYAGAGCESISKVYKRWIDKRKPSKVEVNECMASYLLGHARGVETGRG